MKHATLRKLALAVPMAALAFAVSSAYAASVGPAGMAFYTAPASGPTGARGDLISYRTTTVNLGTGAPGVKAWNVMYQSTDSVGAPNIVTGTVLIPTALWTGSGSRPIISYAVGTHGLAQSCAPSLQLGAGTDYETANINAALKAGYAVLVSDYQGYTTGATPTYLAGASQGHAVLDIFKAALQIPFISLSSNAKGAVWGYSQGGQSAAWAAELAAGYAPAVTLAGIAAGGVPADFKTTAAYLDGSAGASFLLEGVVGLAQQYPTQIPLATLANANGQAAIAKGKSECVFAALFDFMNHSLSEYTVGNQTLAQLQTDPGVNQVLTAQNLGTTKNSVPLYQYHGQADEFIPLAQDITLKKNYCSKLGNVTFAVYPGEHIMTQFQAAPYVLSWLGDRFNGKATSSNCIEFAPQPQSTANPGGGDFIVSLKSWPLSGSITVKNLLQTLQLPAGSSFTADTNLTKSTLNGTMSVPDFTSNINILSLIPAKLTTRVTPTGPATGTATLDAQGQLHVHGHVFANISVVSLTAVGILPIPAGCTTETPVDFAIDFDGPVSSLGNGSLTFTGTTTFPKLAGCGSNAGLLNGFFAGAGQKYSFTVTPPAPVGW